MLDNTQFLLLKNRYYKEGVDNSLPGSTKTMGAPGKANNREQNALRWGYDAALKDIQQRINRFIEEV